MRKLVKDDLHQKKPANSPALCEAQDTIPKKRGNRQKTELTEREKNTEPWGETEECLGSTLKIHHRSDFLIPCRVLLMLIY